MSSWGSAFRYKGEPSAAERGRTVSGGDQPCRWCAYDGLLLYIGMKNCLCLGFRSAYERRVAGTMGNQDASACNTSFHLYFSKKEESLWNETLPRWESMTHLEGEYSRGSFLFACCTAKAAWAWILVFHSGCDSFMFHWFLLVWASDRKLNQRCWTSSSCSLCNWCCACTVGSFIRTRLTS